MDPLLILGRYLATSPGPLLVMNAFCPTGPGGGIDPTCSPGTSSALLPTSVSSGPPHPPDWLVEHGRDAVRDAPAKDRGALLDYSAHGYSAINTALRGAGGDLKKVDGDTRSYVESVEKVVKSGADFPTPQVVYRGISADRVAASELTKLFRESSKTGEPFTMPTPTSTSLDHGVATRFSGGQVPLVLRITAKRGLYLEPYSEIGGEHEVLLSKDSRYKVRGVTNVRYGGNRTITTVHLEQV